MCFMSNTSRTITGTRTAESPSLIRNPLPNVAFEETKMPSIGNTSKPNQRGNEKHGICQTHLGIVTFPYYTDPRGHTHQLLSISFIMCFPTQTPYVPSGKVNRGYTQNARTDSQQDLVPTQERLTRTRAQIVYIRSSPFSPL